MAVGKGGLGYNNIKNVLTRSYSARDLLGLGGSDFALRTEQEWPSSNSYLTP